jgi:hypothetical protein
MRRLGRGRIDWQRVQASYDAGLGARSCMALFGLTPAAWTAAAESGVLRTRPHGIPFDALLEAGRRASPREQRRAAGSPGRCRAAARRSHPPEAA